MRAIRPVIASARWGAALALVATSCLAAEEAAKNSLALPLVPSLVGSMMPGEKLAGVAVPVARATGIALTALGFACWPGPTLAGLLTYSAGVTRYLAFVGLAGGFSGSMPRPTVALTWS